MTPPTPEAATPQQQSNYDSLMGWNPTRMMANLVMGGGDAGGPETTGAASSGNSGVLNQITNPDGGESLIPYRAEMTTAQGYAPQALYYIEDEYGTKRRVDGMTPGARLAPPGSSLGQDGQLYSETNPVGLIGKALWLSGTESPASTLYNQASPHSTSDTPGEARRNTSWGDAAKNTLASLSPGYLADSVERTLGLGAEVMEGKVAPNDVMRNLEFVGNVSGGGGAFAKSGSAGIFGGRLAATADHAALARAEQMAAKGAQDVAALPLGQRTTARQALAGQIYKETGWFQGPDGKWRFEIADNTANYTPALHGGQVALPDVLDHPELYAAYPQLKDMSWQAMQASEAPGSWGDFDPSKGAIRVSDSVAGRTAPGKSVTLHEATHGVQGIEGFTGGTNLSRADDFGHATQVYEDRVFDATLAYQDAMRAYKLDPTPINKRTALAASNELAKIGNAPSGRDMLDAYRRQAGEVEARNVQDRINMDADERRAIPPWETQDIPTDEQFVQTPRPGMVPAAVAESVDDGRPMRVYHGSPQPWDGPYDPSKARATAHAQPRPYFADSPDEASGYALSRGDTLRGKKVKATAPNVMSADVTLKKPFNGSYNAENGYNYIDPDEFKKIVGYAPESGSQPVGYDVIKALYAQEADKLLTPEQRALIDAPYDPNAKGYWGYIYDKDIAPKVWEGIYNRLESHGYDGFIEPRTPSDYAGGTYTKVIPFKRGTAKSATSGETLFANAHEDSAAAISAIGQSHNRNMTPFYGEDVGPKGRIPNPELSASELNLKSGLPGAPKEGFFNPATAALLQAGVAPKQTVTYYAKQMGSRGGKLPPGIWEKATKGLGPDTVVERDWLVQRLDDHAPDVQRRFGVADGDTHEYGGKQKFAGKEVEEAQYQNWATQGPFENYTETSVGYPTRGQLKPSYQAIKNHEEYWNKLNEQIRAQQERVNDLRRQNSTEYADAVYDLRALENRREDIHRRMVDETAAASLPGQYTDSHFDHPNLEGWYRTQDTERGLVGQELIDSVRSGRGLREKTRIIEEVQPQRYQKMRDLGEGVPTEQISAWGTERNSIRAQMEVIDKERKSLDHNQPGSMEKLAQLTNEWRQLDDRQRHIGTQIAAGKQGVQPSPYTHDVNAATDFLLKNAVRDAAEDGIDKLAWTPGEAQADRYNQLLKGVKALRYDPERGSLQIGRHPGRATSDIEWSGGGLHTPDKLAEVVGKDAAEALLASPVVEVDKGSIRPFKAHHIDFPQGMTLGGEGMKGFYGSGPTAEGGILPSRIKSLWKKITGQEPDVKPQSIVTGANQEPGSRAMRGMQMTQQYPSVPMDAAMREKVKKTGLSLFANADEKPGVILAALTQPREIDANGFYSPSLEAAKNLKQQKGTVAQFRSMILDPKYGGKEKELTAVGFDKAFPDPNAKVTRQQIEDYLRDNRVTLGRVTFGGKVPYDPQIDRMGRPEYTEDGIRHIFYDRSSGDEFTLIEDADAGNVSVQAPDGSWINVPGRMNKQTVQDGVSAIHKWVREREAALGPKVDGPPQFENYSTPGGVSESYRENITTLPPKKSVADEVRAIVARAKSEGRELTDAEQDFLAQSADRMGLPVSSVRTRAASPEEYTSSHWPGVTNPLLHYRTKDFPGVEGGKTKVVDEFQSDWAQRGRDQGIRGGGDEVALRQAYNEAAAAQNAAEERLSVRGKELLDQAYPDEVNSRGYVDARLSSLARDKSVSPEVRAEANALFDRYLESKNVAMDALNKYNSANSGVPDAPFIRNTSDWTDLAIKQALIDSARDPAVNRMAWTPGEVQAKRYNLSSHVDSIDVLPPGDGSAGRGRIAISMTGGTKPRFYYDANGTITGASDRGYAETVGKNLSELVGEDLSKKILSTQQVTTLRGIDLDVGGQGMVKYYGSGPEAKGGIVPQRIKDIVKKLDPRAAKIEQTPVIHNKAYYGRGDLDKFNDPTVNADGVRTGEISNYPSIPITPEMRNKIINEGLSLFNASDPYASAILSTIAREGLERFPEGTQFGLPLPDMANGVTTTADVAGVAGRKLDRNGFYSVLDEALSKEAMKQGTAQQWLNAVKRHGTKDAEIYWRGLDDFLKTKKPNEKFTKDEVQAHLEKNKVELYGEKHTQDGDTPERLRERERENVSDNFRYGDFDPADYGYTIEKMEPTEREITRAIGDMRVVDEGDGSFAIRWKEESFGKMPALEYFDTEAEANAALREHAIKSLDDEDANWAIKLDDGSVIDDGFGSEDEAMRAVQERAVEAEIDRIDNMSDEELFRENDATRGEDTSNYIKDEAPGELKEYRETPLVLKPETVARKGSKGWPKKGGGDVHPDSPYNNSPGWRLESEYSDMMNPRQSGTVAHEIQSRWAARGADKGWKKDVPKEELDSLLIAAHEAERAIQDADPERYRDIGYKVIKIKDDVTQPDRIGRIAYSLKRAIDQDQRNIEALEQRIVDVTKSPDSNTEHYLHNYQPRLDEERASLKRHQEEWDRDVAPHIDHVLDPTDESFRDALTPELIAYNDWQMKVDQAKLRYHEANSRYESASEGVDPGPWVTEKSDIMALLLKHGLYEAAERGDDFFGVQGPARMKARWGDSGPHEDYGRIDPKTGKESAVIPMTLQKLARMHDKNAKVEPLYPGKPPVARGKYEEKPMRSASNHQHALPFDGADISRDAGRGMQVASTRKVRDVVLTKDDAGNPVYVLRVGSEERKPEYQEYLSKRSGTAYLTGYGGKFNEGSLQTFKSKAAAERAMAEINESLAAEYRRLRDPEAIKESFEKDDPVGEPFNAIRLTPELRESIVKKGFPLFVNGDEKVAAALAAAGQTESRNPTVRAAQKRAKDVPFDDKLVTQHNMSGSNFRHNESNYGGQIPVPSLAVAKASEPLTNFGDITLFGSPELAIPKGSNPVYPGDAYTARAPKIVRDVPKSADRDRLYEKLTGEKGKGYKLNLDDPFWDDGFRIGYLRSKGMEPPPGKDPGDWARNAIGYGERDAMERFVADWLSANQGVIRERIPKGYNDRTERYEYAPHTLDNMVKATKGKGGSEGFDYGPTSWKARIMQPFKSLRDIQDNRGLIGKVSERDIDKQKSELADQGFNLAKSLGWRDTDPDMVGDGLRSKNEDTRKLAQDLRKGLLELPTEYFEAKPQRAVDLSEFKAAGVPEGLDDVAEALKKRGLDVRRLPQGETERAKALVEMLRTRPDLLFANGDEKAPAALASMASRELSKEDEKQVSNYRAEGLFLRPNHKVEAAMVPSSAFNGTDIRASQTTVDPNGVKWWLKKIEAGERPSVLLEKTDAGNYRIVDGHTRATAYNRAKIDEIPVLIREESDAPVVDHVDDDGVPNYIEPSAKRRIKGSEGPLSRKKQKPK